MKKDIVILGAGLAGSLLSIMLARQGRHVSVYEKRPDPRSDQAEGGRSINLALSHRGIRALEKAGITASLKEIAIPMHGRMMHSPAGELTFQPYGKEGQYINSVSRATLNRLLVEQAARHQVDLHFDQGCEDVSLKDNTFVVRHMQSGQAQQLSAGLLIGADGAFSVLRGAMQKTPRFNYNQYYIAHGYKELTIPVTIEGDFAMEPHALHIWPRGEYMLIALPNQDKSFTCTLFLPYEGKNESFSRLDTEQKVTRFFEEHFSDALALMPSLTSEFFQNPTSDLVTIKSFPWSRYGQSVLIGDAAHAIVPFYGQGMNAAFEDCRIFDELFAKEGQQLARMLERFEQVRKPDADAIAQLALQNFEEMKDKVADHHFLERKKIEAELHKRYPDDWIPLYTMVTFSDMPYARALQLGQQQDYIMQKVMKQYGSMERLKDEDYFAIVNQLREASDN